MPMLLAAGALADVVLDCECPVIRIGYSYKVDEESREMPAQVGLTCHTTNAGPPRLVRALEWSWRSAAPGRPEPPPLLAQGEMATKADGTPARPLLLATYGTADLQASTESLGELLSRGLLGPDGRLDVRNVVVDVALKYAELGSETEQVVTAALTCADLEVKKPPPAGQRDVVTLQRPD